MVHKTKPKTARKTAPKTGGKSKTANTAGLRLTAVSHKEDKHGEMKPVYHIYVDGTKVPAFGIRQALFKHYRDNKLTGVATLKVQGSPNGKSIVYKVRRVPKYPQLLKIKRV